MLIIYFFLFFIIVFYFSFEYFVLNKSVNKIPIRILINGTRGKSTTVRILYNIFKQSNFLVYAKTTGDQPVEYLPNGQTNVLKRRAPVSIIENVRILRKWSKLKPDAIIVECMALHPENQRVLSEKMLKPTHIIITNIFNDHFETMGLTLQSIYQSMQESFIKDAIKIIPKDINEFIETDKKTILFKENPFPKNFTNIPQQLINQNWDLVETVCTQFNIDRKIIELHFQKQWAGIDEKIRLKNKKLNFEFWNLFSINDIDSSRFFVEHIFDLYSELNNLILIFNTRSDRPLRTKSFMPLVNEFFTNAQIILMGDGNKLAKRLISKLPFNNYTTGNSAEIITRLKSGFDEHTVIIGLANHLKTDIIMKELNC